MKKIIYLLTVFFAILMVYSGCKKDEGSSSTPVKYDSAIVSGKAEVNLNKTNDTAGIVMEKVPAGTVLHIRYNSKDLVTVPVAGATYGDVFLTTQVSSAGTYSFSVPVNLNPVTVHITADEFEYQQVQADTTTQRVIFGLNEVSVVVTRGQKKIVDLTFAAQ